jgi:hypothetical protein
MNATRELELRRIALKIALDLSLLSRTDAMAVIRMSEALLDHYCFPIAGLSEHTLQELERVACGSRP